MEINYSIKISYELIYQHIDGKRKAGGTLSNYLPHRGKKYKKRNVKTRRVWKPAVKRKPISKRPPKLLLKKEIGHWEGDTVESKGHRGGIGSFVEMKSNFTIIRRFYPKGTDFNRISEFEIANVQNLLNERPRKILGFRTPKKVFIEEILKQERLRLMLNVC